MKVVGICGSPRKGNSEWMLKRFLESVAKDGAEIDLILLRQKNIKGCDGCLKCEVGGKEREGLCRITDDMEEIYPKLLEADCLVLGTPVYFEMLSGLLKNFIDRTCAIWPRLEGKAIVGIAVAEEGIGKAIDNLKTYSSVCRMHWIGHVIALAKTRVQVSKDKDAQRRIERLARRLVQVLETK